MMIARLRQQQQPVPTLPACRTWVQDYYGIEGAKPPFYRNLKTHEVLTADQIAALTPRQYTIEIGPFELPPSRDN